LKYFPLVWNGLWRNRARTLFTLLSITVAFILFGILAGVDAGFAHSLEASRMDRLFADPKFGTPLPISYAEQIARVPGVLVVAPRMVLGGYYQDPKNGLGVMCRDVRFFSLRPEIQISKQQMQLLERTRTGAAVSVELARKYGWKVGDKIPLNTTTAQMDGNKVWTFDLVAIIDDRDYPGEGGWFLANYKYYDEARLDNKGTITRFLVRISDPGRGAQIGRQIDRLFVNSAAPTRTNSERASTQSGLQYIGDVSYLTRAVLGAVFFMLLCLSGNTMLQSVRERIPEFAALKAMGFSDNIVLLLVIGEAVLLCIIAAAAGLALSELAIPLARTAQDWLYILQMPWLAMLEGFGLALLVALISALLPAWRVKQLSVVDALARR